MERRAYLKISKIITILILFNSSLFLPYRTSTFINISKIALHNFHIHFKGINVIEKFLLLNDEELYKKRNVVERFFLKIKAYRKIATRYKQKARNFLGLVKLASSIVIMRCMNVDVL